MEMVDLKDNQNTLHLSWHDSAWIPHLNSTNILDYFSERSNPFYDRTCNNEIVKMQKMSLEQLKNMSGLEYILLHVQEPILFVIRKQHRRSSENVTPLADYYIIAGYVYQAPDLNSLINSRLYNGIHHLLSAFDEAQGYMKYYPTKGYSWQFNKDGIKDKDSNIDKTKDKQKEEPSSTFQRARVDHLLGELYQKFFPKVNQPLEASKPIVTNKVTNGFNAETNDNQRQTNSDNKNIFKNELTNGFKKFQK